MERLPLVVLQEILRCLVPWSCSKDELSEMADRMWRAQAFKGHLPPAARSGADVPATAAYAVLFPMHQRLAGER